MKSAAAQFFHFLRHPNSRRNIQLLERILLIFVIMVIFYSEVFYLLMREEGQNHSWFSGIYWVLTIMSTLGLGDIVFTTDIGKLFTIVVLLSGLLFLFFLLPAFIQFFYAPWMEAQSSARISRYVPTNMSGHIILTQLDAVTKNLIKKLQRYHLPYVLVHSNFQEALHLHDQGYSVVLGSLDHPETVRNTKTDKAALVVSTASDAINTNVAFTVRQNCKDVPIVTTADADESVDILQLAGSTHVLRVHEMMGQFLARRANAGERTAHIIGQIDQLLIAEADVTWTPLVGKTLMESQLRQTIGMNVIGVWDRGWFEVAKSNTMIRSNTVLVMACSPEQLEAYNKNFGVGQKNKAPVVIIGGGRVGRVVARTLKQMNVDYRVIEKDPSRLKDNGKYILGDAASLDVLEKAGLKQSTSVIITTHDDDTNIYLAIYFRRLRPDIQIISRSTLARNVDTLHRAGADFVVSYASMGANAIFNILKGSTELMVAEGLNVFKEKLPRPLWGKTLAESSIRSKTGCSVVAVNTGDSIQINFDPNQPLPENSEIILIGSMDAEAHFLSQFAKKRKFV